LRQVSYLPDASILEIWNGQTKLTRYWQRNYQKSRRPFQVHAAQLADLVRQSIRRKTSDHQRYGHFLSGGMDSRSVLAAFTDNFPVCFTAAIAENRELRTARNIAQTKGATHVALELHPEHFGQIMKHSVQVCGGMYNYDNGLFYGFEDIVRANADACFHGHGFDYMFQGMYIPAHNLVVGGHTLYLRFPRPPAGDLAQFFIANASYRTKRADIWRYILPERREALRDFQRASVEEILARGRKLTDNPFALFEYLTFHHISRHYSYPNHASIATFTEQRTVSFDNDLFDFYLALPTAQRFNGKIEKAALKILDPRIARIWSANTNLPVTASCWRQTAYQLAGAVKRRIIPEPRKPEWMERTWPSRDDATRQQETLRRALRAVFASGILDSLDFLDLRLLGDEMGRWADGENLPHISGDFIQAILSVGILLRQRLDNAPPII
jgi:asparagine synthetase B (glutamine-hydrolysing)